LVLIGRTLHPAQTKAFLSFNPSRKESIILHDSGNLLWHGKFPASQKYTFPTLIFFSRMVTLPCLFTAKKGLKNVKEYSVPRSAEIYSGIKSP